MLSHCLLLCILPFITFPAFADDTPQKDELARDYYVYAPARIDPKRTYWLVVGVHGHGGDGRGAAGLAAWARKGDCIVVGPSFPDTYQGLRARSDEQLVLLFERLRKQYTLNPKMFLYGFSGGAQFVHRFMMARPDLVAGCAAHSGGSWATGGGWGDVNPAAAGIPFVMSCGEKDTDKMHPTAPMGRLEWARAFEKQLADGKFCYEARYFPNTGHAAAPGVATMTEECYRLATLTVPAHEKRIAEIRDLAKAGKTAQAQAALTRARQASPITGKGLARAVADWQKGELDALAMELGTKE